MTATREDQRPRLASNRGRVDPRRVERVEGLAQQGSAGHRQFERAIRLGAAGAGETGIHEGSSPGGSSSIWATWIRSM